MDVLGVDWSSRESREEVLRGDLFYKLHIDCLLNIGLVYSLRMFR